MYVGKWLGGDGACCVGARRVFGCLELEVLGISEVRETASVRAHLLITRPSVPVPTSAPLTNYHHSQHSAPLGLTLEHSRMFPRKFRLSQSPICLGSNFGPSHLPPSTAPSASHNRAYCAFRGPHGGCAGPLKAYSNVQSLTANMLLTAV
jgi:hypothetical protein